jgi:hypothetical protein
VFSESVVQIATFYRLKGSALDIAALLPKFNKVFFRAKKMPFADFTGMPG